MYFKVRVCSYGDKGPLGEPSTRPWALNFRGVRSQGLHQNTKTVLGGRGGGGAATASLNPDGGCKIGFRGFGFGVEDEGLGLSVSLVSQRVQSTLYSGM